MGRTVIRADQIKEDTLEDVDGDTKVQVEESSDEDKIRFDTAGTERAIIDSSGNVGIGTSSPISKLDVAGKISITSESSTPSQPADGKGYLYTKSDGKLYWRSYDLSETDLTAGGSSGISHDGSTANGVLTYKDSDEATVESNMTFDGNTLTVAGNIDGSYVAVLDNDQNTNGHVLKLLTDGNGSGSRLLEMEDGDGDVLFRARADGRFGFGPDGVSSMGAGTFVVGIDNSSHAADIAISKRLQHLGDSNTYLDFPAADQFQIAVGGVDMLHITEDDSQDKIVFNEAGADVDFRVESNSNTHMLFLNAGADKIGINDDDPISELSVAGKISITAESSTPSAPADGHGWLYTKSDGKIYWQSNDVSETDLTGGGGGSSSDTFVMFQQIEQVNNLSTSYYYYKNVTGGYGWTNTFSPTSFSTSFPYWRIHRYASSGTVPVGSTMTKYRIVGHKDGSDNDTITVKIWKVPAATHGDAETDIPTLVEVVSVEINTDANDIVNKSAAISSNNSFTAGDSWFVTINPTSAYMTSDHYLQLSVEFTVS